MTDTQAIDVVTFDFKGTRVHSFVSGYTDYLMDDSSDTNHLSIIKICKVKI